MELFDVSVDPTAQENGAWIENINDKTGDLKLLVLGASASTLRELNAKLTREREPAYMSDPQYRSDREDYETLEKAKAALLGWENLKIGGNLVPYSPETAAKIIDDPRFESFVTAIYNAITKVNKIKATYDEEAEKNLLNGIALN